ncbi:MAG: type 1 glutamine amidotransferase [Desulfoplanes sp.]
MRIHSLHHVPFEGLGSIAAWAEKNDHSVTTTRLYQDNDFPGMTDFAMLIIMGGPMSVHDSTTYPWLEAEKTFISQAIKADKTILGICLGAQLIAHVLGAKVYPNKKKEIGWFPVNATPNAQKNSITRALPESMEAFHWHGETFSLPKNAQLLASSQACKNQAFLYTDRVLGLQFHLETTPASARSLILHGQDEMVPAPYVQTPEMIMAQPARFEKINALMHALLDALSLGARE